MTNRMSSEPPQWPAGPFVVGKTRDDDESRWSLLTDAQRADVEPSLQLLEGLHARWAYLLRSLAPDAFERSFHHPEKFYDREVVPLWHALAVYAWHAGHHTAQVEWVRKHELSVPGGLSD